MHEAGVDLALRALNALVAAVDGPVPTHRVRVAAFLKAQARPCRYRFLVLALPQHLAANRVQQHDNHDNHQHGNHAVVMNEFLTSLNSYK